MPIFELTDELIFPPAVFAESDGFLAVGGDLSIERLLLAYREGIFPWPFDEFSPIAWASPAPRLIVVPNEAKFSKSLRQIIRRKVFDVRFDTNFESVIKHCANVKRTDENGTWITTAIIEAYINLHRAGYAHSVEVYQQNKLVGGLYGVSLGRAFFGESMFHLVSNASKVAFYHLVERLCEWNFDFIDAQMTTAHLLSLGGKEVARTEFLKLLKSALQYSDKRGKWV